MRWLTWQNVGVDRIGCSWLVRRYIDPHAEFEFIPEGQTPPQTGGCEPFDIPGVRLSHHRGHCSFHAFLDEYKLADPVLRRIARIIDEADTVQDVALEPSAPGLDLICRGVRLSSPDDRTALERGAAVYDALYAALSADAADR
jgi:hypothetical protein